MTYSIIDKRMVRNNNTWRVKREDVTVNVDPFKTKEEAKAEAIRLTTEMCELMVRQGMKLYYRQKQSFTGDLPYGRTVRHEFSVHLNKEDGV